MRAPTSTRPPAAPPASAPHRARLAPSDSTLRLIAAIVGIGVFALSPLVLAQLNRSARARNILFPEYYEKAVRAGLRTNQLKGQLRLEEGQYITNGLILGQGMLIEQYTPEGRTNLVARAPECIVNPVTRIASSTGSLEIIAMEGRFTIRGRQGFEAGVTNTTLTLSNRVRTILNQNLLKPLP